MKKEKKCDDKCGCGHHKIIEKGPGFYCLGAIGAVIYFISTATTFWLGVLGVLKALVWPAFLVYALMKYLGM